MVSRFKAGMLALAAFAMTAHAQDFAYHAPGKLLPSPTGKASGAGGSADRTIFAPGMGLPIRLGDGEGIYLNSQVYRPGGMHGGNGGACHKSNYAMPWADNFCEQRPHATLFCPGGRGHQGVDIRPPLCRDKAAVAVAVEDGTIMGINQHTSSVTLKGGKTGSTYLYLHLHPPSIVVKLGQRVKAGAALGRVSNFMNGGPSTTVHLHFEVRQNVEYGGRPVFTPVPPYASLVNAYRRHLGLPALEQGGALAVDAGRER
jgi:murein DD-endopeptidase MepM/ murein hydrolase activator NlpD